MRADPRLGVGQAVARYEYSVYGHVAASSLRSAYSAEAAAKAGRATAEDGSDPNHPNPFMFTGRQFDIETGLYYYRAWTTNSRTNASLSTAKIEGPNTI